MPIRNGYDVVAYWEKRAKDAEARADAAEAENKYLRSVVESGWATRAPVEED